jgi:hypothetical protein
VLVPFKTNSPALKDLANDAVYPDCGPSATAVGSGSNKDAHTSARFRPDRLQCREAAVRCADRDERSFFVTHVLAFSASMDGTGRIAGRTRTPASGKSFGATSIRTISSLQAWVMGHFQVVNQGLLEEGGSGTANSPPNSRLCFTDGTCADWYGVNEPLVSLDTESECADPAPDSLAFCAYFCDDSAKGSRRRMRLWRRGATGGIGRLCADPFAATGSPGRR